MSIRLADHRPQTTDHKRRLLFRRLGSVVCGLWIITWLGAALRFRGLLANTFHADEALFAAWARHIAVWRDPLLLSQAVDKPPLSFYLQALFYPLFGPVEFAARLPALVASILLIPLTAQLTRRLTHDRTAALVAAAVVALSPLAIQFSATAFTDPLLAFWLAAALYAAAGGGRPGPSAAGLLFGLALATKYQALLFAPLLVGVAWLAGWRASKWLRAGGGFGAVIVILLLWSDGRSAAGVVALQWANIGGVRVVHSWELWPRLVATARLWRLALGGGLIAAIALAVAGFLTAHRPRIRANPTTALLLLFLVGYLGLHWLWAVPVWDRYLLPLLPLMAVLIGRGMSLALTLMDRRLSRWIPIAGLTLLTVIQLPFALNARLGGYPIGGQPAANGGAARIARLLEDAPYGTVLYDHWYSWQWRYQLFDSRVYVSWFPHADALLDDLAAFAGVGPERYIVLPATDAARPVVRRLTEKGYRLEALPIEDKTVSMTLYRIHTEGVK